MNEITLRSVCVDDAEAINRIRNQSAEFLHDNTKFSIESTKKWMKDQVVDWHAIELDGKMIGYFRLSNWSMENRHIYIGADIEESHRGKGIGTVSYIMMMEKLFKERRLNKISLEVLSSNTRAYELYKRLGFFIEGRKRQEVWRDGSWHDSIIMSITRKEFMMLYPERIQSPCIGICHKDEHVCSSCGRTIQQIAGWKGLSKQDAAAYVADASNRIEQQVYKNNQQQKRKE